MTALNALKKQSVSAREYWQLIRIATIAKSSSHARKLAERLGWDEESSESVETLTQIHFEYGQRVFENAIYGMWGSYKSLICLHECHRNGDRKSCGCCEQFVNECFCACHICQSQDPFGREWCYGFGLAEVAEMEWEPCFSYDSDFCDSCAYRHLKGEWEYVDHSHPRGALEYFQELLDCDDEAEFDEKPVVIHDYSSFVPSPSGKLVKSVATKLWVPEEELVVVPSRLERVSSIAEPLFGLTSQELAIEVKERLGSSLIQAHADFDDKAIRFTEQLVDLLDEDDELAWVVAHEIAHIERRHSERWSSRAEAEKREAVALTMRLGRERKEQGRGLIYRTVTGTLTFAAALGQMTAKLRELSREHETEADTRALELMGQIGYDIGASVESLKKLHNGYLSGYTRMFDTHPSAHERVRALEEEIERRKNIENQ